MRLSFWTNLIWLCTSYHPETFMADLSKFVCVWLSMPDYTQLKVVPSEISWWLCPVKKSKILTDSF